MIGRWMRAGVVALVMAAMLAAAPGWGQEKVLTINVNLKENGTNAAVKGGWVQMYLDSRQYSAVSGDDGVAHFELPAQDVSRAVLQATGDGWVKMQTTWNRGTGQALPEHFDVAMEKAVEIGGVVVDQAGKPVGGATVMVQVHEKFPGNPGQSIAYQREPILTDDSGRWTSYGAPAKFDSAELGASHPECLGEYGFVPITKFTDLDGLRAKTAQFKLERGTPIDIEVRGPGGKPVTDATVGYGGDRVASNAIPLMPVDYQGKLRIGVKPGTMAVLTVKSPVYAPELKDIPVGSEPIHVVFDLTSGKVLTGRVVDGDGNGVPSARVYFDTWRQNRTLDRSVTTDGAGNFRWEHAPEDELKVDVLERDFAAKRGVVIKAGQENLITINRPTVFHGTVVDGETGAPVKSFKVVEGVQWRKEEPVSFLDPVTQFQKSEKEGEFEVRLNEYEHIAFRVTADGYLPGDSEVIDNNGHRVDFTYRMKKAANILGVLADAQGKPVKGAAVYIAGPGEYLNIRHDMEISSQAGELHKQVTDDQGRFSFPPQVGSYLLLAVGDDGYAMATREQFEKGQRLTLLKWGRIEGEVREGTRPVPGAKMMLTYRELENSVDQSRPIVLMMDYFTADENGKFVAEKVMAETVQVATRVESQSGRFMSVMVGVKSPWTKVEAGQTVRMTVGGHGRTVTGKLALPPGIPDSGVEMRAMWIRKEKTIAPPMTVELMEMTMAERQRWNDDYWKSDEGKKVQAARQEQFRNATRVVAIGADRSFKIQDVETGDYNLGGTVLTQSGNPQRSDPKGRLDMLVHVDAGEGQIDRPLDLGTVQFFETPRPLEVGDDASEASLVTVDGKPVKLSDFKGKYLVLNLWMAQWKESLPDREGLGTLWEKYGKGGEVAMLGVHTAAGDEAMKMYIAARPMAWPQARPDENKISDATRRLLATPAVRSQVWLIGPDGKVILKDSDAFAVRAELEKRLGK